MLSEFLALCKKTASFTELGYLGLLVRRWGEGLNKERELSISPGTAGQERSFISLVEIKIMVFQMRVGEMGNFSHVKTVLAKFTLSPPSQTFNVGSAPSTVLY